MPVLDTGNASMIALAVSGFAGASILLATVMRAPPIRTRTRPERVGLAAHITVRRMRVVRMSARRIDSRLRAGIAGANALPVPAIASPKDFIPNIIVTTR